jgi:hypothetical protein
MSMDCGRCGHPGGMHDGGGVRDEEFKYNKDADAVLQVTPNGYDTCNTSQPLLRLTDGDSRFVLKNQGYYYFISSDAGRCRDGERLIVLAMHNKEKGHMNAPSPVPLTPPLSSPPSRSLTVALNQAAGVLALCICVVGTAIL